MKINNFGSFKHHPTFRYLFVFFVSISGLYISSCSAPKNITYFRDIPDTIKQKVVQQAQYNTPTIHADDILQVDIQTLDVGATTLMNPAGTANWPVNGAGAAGANMQNVSGFLVDKNGDVILPLIGKVKVEGKTTNQVRDEIQAKASEYYKQPVVTVRFANFKVTVLGEVARPATYLMPNEKVTLLDAIGVAGDLTIFGKRENVLLIRNQSDNKKEFIRFNLNESQTFSSPYFFLQQGDVVYVEPNKSKVVSTDAARLKNITIFSSAITLIVVILTRIKF